MSTGVHQSSISSCGTRNRRDALRDPSLATVATAPPLTQELASQFRTENFLHGSILTISAVVRGLQFLRFSSIGFMSTV